MTTIRLEFRVSPACRAHIERAAALAGERVAAFARAAAKERADRVLREQQATTTVPSAFFDELLTALDTPAQANLVLAAAAKRLRKAATRG